MTVKELIKKLSEMPQELRVEVGGWDIKSISVISPPDEETTVDIDFDLR